MLTNLDHNPGQGRPDIIRSHEKEWLTKEFLHVFVAIFDAAYHCHENDYQNQNWWQFQDPVPWLQRGRAIFVERIEDYGIANLIVLVRAAIRFNPSSVNSNECLKSRLLSWSLKQVLALSQVDMSSSAMRLLSH